MKKNNKKNFTKNDGTSRNQFSISENNRITYVWRHNKAKKKVDIVCVSLEVKILDDWVTIIFYDNYHGGLLHRHTRIAYNDEADIVDYNGVKKKGTSNKHLQWAIDDLKRNYRWYKKRFLQRNKQLLGDIEVDEF